MGSSLIKHILDFIEKYLDYIENVTLKDDTYDPLPRLLFFEREALTRISKKCTDILNKVENISRRSTK